MLCRACKSIFDRTDTTSLTYDGKTPRASHHLSLTALAQAAGEDCYICYRLLKLWRAGSAASKHKFARWFQLERIRDPSMWLVDFRLPSEVHKSSIPFFLTQIQPSASNDVNHYLTSNSIANTTNHPNVFFWARNHLRQCERQHHCGLGSDRGWVPPRVLDLMNNQL